MQHLDPAQIIQSLKEFANNNLMGESLNTVAKQIGEIEEVVSMQKQGLVSDDEANLKIRGIITNSMFEHDRIVNPANTKFVNSISALAKGTGHFKQTRSEATATQTCCKCGASCPLESFRDECSRREYGMTRWCQNCQDEFFGA